VEGKAREWGNTLFENPHWDSDPEGQGVLTHERNAAFHDKVPSSQGVAAARTDGPRSGAQAKTAGVLAWRHALPTGRGARNACHFNFEIGSRYQSAE
jgi:hypothetical protein